MDKFTPTPRTYTKRNFVDLIELITPGLYQEEDLNLSGTGLNPLSQIINTHLTAANNISQVLSISAVANSQTSALDTISGISQYFVKQNELTNISPYLFETKILIPLGKSIKDYDTSAAFNKYIGRTLLPMTQLCQGGADAATPIVANIATLSALTGDANPSSVHNYLTDALGWLYFLNTSADGGLAWEPSGYVLEQIDKLYVGGDIETVEGVEGFENYIWRNYSTCTTFSNLGLIPSEFVSGAADAILEPSAGIVATYTSGTQKLENLLTLINVIYSPAYMDQQDFTVEEAFNNYIDASLLLSNNVSKGPFRKFINALGFSFADITDQVENIGLIYDIENAPDNYLPLIADLIGWKLFGASPSKWREQLRRAVDLYKRKGTLDSIQHVINTLITDSVFDVSGKAMELWESYLPFMIWYSLGTESPYFRDLTTWTPGLAVDAGVFSYSPSSLDENLKIVTDSIILDLYKKFPNNFLFNGEPFPVSRLYVLDNSGNPTEIYTITNEPGMKPFHIHVESDPGYQSFHREAVIMGHGAAWDAANTYGPLGTGVYMAGLEHPSADEDHIYLSATGDLEFVFNYRSGLNLPLPPFEEIRYYKDSALSLPLVSYLKERLKCFGVNSAFASEVENFIVSAGITTDTNLGSLNEFLMFFSSVQVPPNYNDFMFNISNYQQDLLGLWNGKSSHLFIDFDNTNFDFGKTTLEGDSRYALYNAARVAQRWSPAHTIPRVNLNASAEDSFDYSGASWHYLGVDKDDNRAGYTSASILGNYEDSGVAMGTVSPGDNDGRGGLNTFKRIDVDKITDTLLSSTTAITNRGTVSRRALRRRNLKYVLPREGYYDRTGFNAPNSWEASTLENSMPSSLGELTLGYLASAGSFYPIIDPIAPSGVWHQCEDLNSTRTFSGIDTSNTFPYRGLSSLGSNTKWNEFSVSTARYVDRGQIPPIYIVMHELWEAKAKDLAISVSSVTPNTYWKNEIQSYANSAIASGYILNSMSDYDNFTFGVGLQKLFRDYNKYLKNPLSLVEVDKTGGNIFAQVFGKGLYNCDFLLAGSATETISGNYISSSTVSALPLNQNEGSGIFSTCAVAGYSDGSIDLPASGTYIASDAGDIVIPLSGTSYVSGNPNNAEFRNPHILSGVEFCDISGSPAANAFYVFKINNEFKIPGEENYLIDNPIIKCKSAGGLPRLRFDLSAYGDRRNYFLKDHHFKFKVKALVGEENSPILGGGQLGVWIHTSPVFNSETITADGSPSGLMWSWTPKGKWEMHDNTRTSITDVVNLYSHIYTFDLKQPDSQTQTFCLGNTIDQSVVINNLTLNNIQEKYFETFELTFDTRNYTIHNNYEYLKIIPVPEEYYKLQELVNRYNINYYVEVFFIPPAVPEKYLLIDSISLEDSTQRENAGIGTDHGILTSGNPLRKFVKEDKLYLDKEQLRTVLKLYEGLTGSGTGLYATNLASREAPITSGTMEVSGGSRLNYRISPSWGAGNSSNTQANYNNFTKVEVDN